MATVTLPDITIGEDWTDLVDGNGDLASVDCVVQNKPRSREPIFVVFGGNEPTTNNAGFLLHGGDSVSGNAESIWVRSASPGSVAVATI